MMSDLNQTLKCLCTTLFFLFIVLLSSCHSVSSSLPSSTQQIQVQNDPSSSVPIPTHYQVFHLENPNPIFQERIKKRLKKKKVKKHRKKMTKNLIKSRPFSVMLPKGFVPPSGSSPCHNEYPTSVSFHCHLSASQP